ncbi:MAG: hypothetical protein ACE5KM_06615 [Planctomycetaceae bacterium]
MTQWTQISKLRRNRMRFAVIVGTTIIISSVAGWVAYRRHHDYNHFAVHQDGRIYRSGWLAPSAMRDVIEGHQIRTVVNLCDPTEMSPDDWQQERKAVAKSGARVLEIPMPLTTRLNDDSIRRFVKILGSPEFYPILVHCRHGVTRTAKLLAIYDIAYRGMSANESLHAMPLFGRKNHNVHVRAFAREFEKRYRELYPDARPSRLAVLRDADETN